MAKSLTKKDGEIHLGTNSPAGFEPATNDDMEKILPNLGDMKLWRCNVCNDLHIGSNPLKICPTCGTIDAYVEIDETEFRAVLRTFLE